MNGVTFLFIYCFNRNQWSNVVCVACKLNGYNHIAREILLKRATSRNSNSPHVSFPSLLLFLLQTSTSLTSQNKKNKGNTKSHKTKPKTHKQLQSNQIKSLHFSSLLFFSTSIPNVHTHSLSLFLLFTFKTQNQNQTQKYIFLHLLRKP